MKILLDSNIIIYAAKPEHSRLRKKLTDLEGDYCVSAITILEVLGYHLLTDQDKTELENFFTFTPMLPIDDLVIKKGIQLRQNHKMSLGDAIIAATALNHNLKIWSNNITDFDNVPGIKLENPLS
jgi:predicted nucleic acid-binding protein